MTSMHRMGCRLLRLFSVRSWEDVSTVSRSKVSGGCMVALGFPPDEGLGLSYELTWEKDVNTRGWQSPCCWEDILLLVWMMGISSWKGRESRVVAGLSHPCPVTEQPSTTRLRLLPNTPHLLPQQSLSLTVPSAPPAVPSDVRMAGSFLPLLSP